MDRSLLTTAILTSIALTACGGGGGSNVRDTPTAAVTTPVAPTTSTPPATSTPVATTCEDASATNKGGALPCTYHYDYAGTKDNVLVPTTVAVAHAQGFDGAGVKVGVLDDAPVDGYAPLTGKIASYVDFTGEGTDPTTNTMRGHGTVMGAVIAGTAAGSFSGGVAPAASLYWGRVCYNNYCTSEEVGSAIDRFGSAGVRLFNLSLGSLAATGEETRTASSWGLYMQSVLTYDALVVASTGNNGATTANYPAAVPAQLTKFANNWLAVANVSIDAKGQPGALDSTSNQCGQAAQWCLVAPGYLLVPAVGDTAFQGSVNGTSSATAIVTGSAALVWQAYPWMSASNVQQTLLTTATDLGNTGVDAVYGWGMLNAGKAVQGPGQLGSAFTANVTDGYDSTFSNDISGSGSLIKSGAGRLALSGANSYTGGTSVTAGTLALSGSLGSNLSVSSGATFESRGGIVNGNYSVNSSTATTALQIGSGLTVTGHATLKGTLKLLASATDYVASGTETVLKAGTLSGSFGNVSYGSDFFYTATLAYGTDSVSTTLTRSSVAAASAQALAPTAVIEVGARVDALLAETDQWVAEGDTQGKDAIVAATASLMSAPTTAAALASLRSLEGEVHGTSRVLAMQQASTDALLLAERANALGGYSDTGLWFQSTGADGTLRQSGYASARFHQYGVMLGADLRFSDGVKLGAALSHSRNTADLDALAGHTKGSSTGLAVYGRFGADAAYLTGVLGYAQLDADTERSVLLGTALETLTSHRTDTVMHARIEAGYALTSGIAPFVATGALRNGQDAFSEAGAGGLGLEAGGDTHTATFAEAGVRVNRTFDASGRALSAGGYLLARHYLSGEDVSYTARFVGAQDSRFSVGGQYLPQNSQRGGLNLSGRIVRKWSWYVDAGIERASGQPRSVFGAAGIRAGI